mgnify:CR=1 FL=1
MSEQVETKREPLLFCTGNREGVSFRMKATSSTIERKIVHVLHGRVEGAWNRIGVISSVEHKYRFFEIEPDTAGSEIRGPQGFFVRGPFKIVRKENNPRRANEAWKAFRAS